MTQHEIVALRCPSCGSGITEPSRDKSFGAEFRCEVCGISSVLIIDRALIPLGTLQKAGEKICVSCGRVAQREARFCQEGHKLFRKCNYSYCGREFPVEHQRCDFCGGVQDAEDRLVHSPIEGTFFRSSPSLARPFVEVGDHVTKGQTLCIIEAFGLMNEIECEHDGEIVAINVTDNSPVQYGQKLFAMKVD